MTFEDLQTLMGQSASLRLLRAKSAPLIISFLFKEFKAVNQLVRPQYELSRLLAEYLDYLGGTEGRESETELRTIASQLLQTWSDEQHQYLRRYPDERGEPMLELTPATELAFQWLEGLQQNEFVGTESRFLHLSQQLQEVVNNASADPEQRIAELEKQRKALNDEIREIRKSGRARTYTDTQIKERFFTLSRNARELVADFKQVEENFKEISREIYQQQTRQEMGRGQILGFTLDATDALKESDQGRSFYAFWQFLIADHRQDELSRLISQMYEVLDNRGISAQDAFLKRIKFYLHNAGQKVLDSNHLIAEKLSRILAEQNRAEHRRTRDLIKAIKHQAVEKRGQFQGQRAFIYLEGEPVLDFSLDRPLGSRPETSSFAAQPQALAATDLEKLDLSELHNQFDLDRKQLQRQVDGLLAEQPSARLDEVIAVFPLQKGLAEVIGYLSLASAHKVHHIDRHKQMEIAWQEDAQSKRVKVPEVVFRRKL